MIVRKLDLTPKGVLYKTMQFTVEKNPFVIQATINDDNMKHIDFILGTTGYMDASVQSETSIYINSQHIDSLIELLQAAKQYLSKPYRRNKKK